jgi:hypothetical protein
VEEVLFSSGDLRLALEAQAKRMCEAVEVESEASLKQADPHSRPTAMADCVGAVWRQLLLIQTGRRSLAQVPYPRRSS